MRKTVLAAGLALASIAGAANAATIINGSFEIGPNPGSFATLGTGNTGITGWTVTNGSIDYIGSYWQAQDGTRSIDLAGSSVGTIAQDFATNIGETYAVTYWIARNPDGGVNARTGFVSAGGTQSQFTYGGSGNRANMQWQQETFQFTATNAITTLSFAADAATAGGFYGPALDNVSIATVAAAVPEPSTWAMLILGFGLVGGTMRRTRATKAALRFA